MTSADTFILAGAYQSERAAERQLRRGELNAVVEVPPRFGERVAAGRVATFGVVVDGSNATVASRARAYVVEVAAGYAQQRSMGSMRKHPGVQPSVRVWYNADLTNTRFIAIAMIAQAGFMLAILLPADGMVREKQNGTMEQIRVTPIRAHELFIGKIVPPIVVTTGLLFPSLLIAKLLGVPMHGSVPLLFILNLLALLSAVSIGVFIGTITNTLQQALLTSFFSLFPLLFLSGSVTPLESMPRWLQTGIEVSPLRHSIAIFSGLFLKGSGVSELWPHIGGLAVISAVMFSSAWLLFRRSW
jgi:ABC-2 type transport system permease protein